jgi:murein DD-endopeptidase MepM/ murein hydrolase activator NlpD
MSARTTHARPRGGVLLILAVAAVLALLASRGNPTWPDTLPGTGGPPAGGGVGRVVDPLPDGRVSSGFGPRTGGMHYGTDIAAPLGTPIRSVAAGTVIDAGPATGFGLWVRIRHGDDTVSVYGHMQTITTHDGARVGAGEQIATVGARGHATGPHLHLEIWPHGDRGARVDPAAWLATHGARLPGGRS